MHFLHTYNTYLYMYHAVGAANKFRSRGKRLYICTLQIIEMSCRKVADGEGQMLQIGATLYHGKERVGHV